MNRTKAQPSANARLYSKKRKREYARRAEELGINLIFPYQTRYKTLGRFVAAYPGEHFLEAACEALNTLDIMSWDRDTIPHTYYHSLERAPALEQAQVVVGGILNGNED